MQSKHERSDNCFEMWTHVNDRVFFHDIIGTKSSNMSPKSNVQLISLPMHMLEKIVKVFLVTNTIKSFLIKMYSL